jgi:hypothetical protein
MPNTPPLTSAQARAIREADALCFDHRMLDPRTGESYGAIRAIVRRRDGDDDITTTIPIESSRVQDYSPTSSPNGHVAFSMIQSAQYSDKARTLTRRIKAGTRIAFVWTRDNSSPVTRDAGIYVDMLDVQVQNGSVCDTFRVDTFIGLDNTARMVRVQH